MRRNLRAIKLESFTDIVALLALYRPGPMQFIPDFIKRKKDKNLVTVPHPALAEVLQETLGLAIYQEQVIQIVQIIADFTLGEADELRRIMGKKIEKLMPAQKAKFLAGAERKHGLDTAKAEEVFAYCENFAQYGFNKAHAVAYAMITMQTAWLKKHYFAEYLCSTFNFDYDTPYKVLAYLYMFRLRHFTIVLPDINRSHFLFTLADAETLVCGLCIIKGVGADFAKHIVEQRTQGDFSDMRDFCVRMSGDSGLNKGALEAMVAAGVFDSLNPNRGQLCAQVDYCLKINKQLSTNRKQGMVDMFGHHEPIPSPPKNAANWDMQTVLKREYEAYGAYLTRFPMHHYRDELQRLGVINIGTHKVPMSPCLLVGCICSVKRFRDKHNQESASIECDDSHRLFSVRVDKDMFAGCAELLTAERLKEDTMIFIDGQRRRSSTGDMQIEATRIFSLSALRAAHCHAIALDIPHNDMVRLEAIKALLHQHRKMHGRGLAVTLSLEGNNQTIHLDDEWRVQPSNDFFQQLREDFPHIGYKLLR